MGTLIGNPHGHIRFRMRAPIKLPVTSWSVCSAAHVHRPGAPASGQKEPPAQPPSAKQYTDAGLPWFDYYGQDAVDYHGQDAEAVSGSSKLAKLKSVLEMGRQKGESPLPENESVTPQKVVNLGTKRTIVREGQF